MERTSRQRVGLVPASIYQHPECSCEEQAIYGFMSNHADRPGYLWLGLATIADAVKLDRGKVRRRIEKLIALGFIERMAHPNPEIRCWMYRLVGHDQLLAGLLGDDKRPADGLHQTPETAPIPAPIYDRDEHEHDEYLIEESLSCGHASAPQEREAFEVDGGNEVAPTAPSPLPENWVPSLADMAFAQVVRTDLTPQDVALVTEKFIKHYRGQHLPDPSALFRSWLKNERKSHACTKRYDRRTSSNLDDGPRCRSQGGKPASIAERNRAAAGECLRRVLARRGEHLSA
jgi:hypothetical protein